VAPLQFFDIVFGTDPALDPQEGYYQRLLARDEVEAGEILDAYLEEHTFSELCDLVLLPALVRAKEDQHLGRLSDDDVSYIVVATTELVEDIEAPAADKPEEPMPPLLVLACPAKDQLDQLALSLLHKTPTPGGKIRVLDSRLVAAEVIDLVRRESPAAFLVAAVHPGGLAKIRYLVKRLRAAFPALHIQAGYWGVPQTDTKLPQQLKTLGASEVSASMSETVRQLEGFLRVAPHLKATAQTSDTAPGDTAPGDAAPGDEGPNGAARNGAQAARLPQAARSE
jgi:hypothetical protein